MAGIFHRRSEMGYARPALVETWSMRERMMVGRCGLGHRRCTSIFGSLRENVRHPVCWHMATMGEQAVPPGPTLDASG